VIAAATVGMPQLISVRGWTAVDDPRYPAFVDAVRAGGVDIHDLFVPGDSFATLGDWARAVVAELASVAVPGEPLHLVGYCLGGHLVWEVVGQLEAIGTRPAYVGLIDCWYRPPAQWVDRGIYHRYGVGWHRRVRHQAGRLAPPRNERLSAVVRSWVVRFARTAGRSMRGRTLGRERLKVRNWHGQHLSYDWFYPRLRVPVHLYNSEESVADMDGDPSMGLAPYLIAGFDVRVFADTQHWTCLQPPWCDHLIDLIAQHRQAALGRDSTATRPAPTTSA
jgi:hypothetical protein